MNIILIHRGDAFFLKNNILKILELNENANIYLIGDESNKYIEQELNYKIKHIFINNCLDENDTNYNYRHYSTNNKDYEKFCIDRWIILYKLMNIYNLDEVFYLDSDVLILSNDIFSHFYDLNYDLVCQSHLAVMPCCIFFKKNILELFVKYLYNLYSLDDLNLYNTLMQIYNITNAGNDLHISDMLLIGDFKCNYINNEIYKIKGVSFNYNEESNVYINDNLINITNHNIIYKNNNYYINNSKILNFHFQGYAKKIYNLIYDLIHEEKDFIIFKHCDENLNDNNYNEYIKF